MKYFLIILLLVTSMHAQNSATPTTNPKDTALENIFSTMGSKEFPKALAAAQKAGLHPQVILEARFLHHVEQRDDKAIAKMVPEFLAFKNTFNSNNSAFFAVKEDWLAITHYAQALAALQKSDTTNFKKHITEAFWLSPKQAQAFAPHIEQLRLKEAMANLELDPNFSLTDQETKQPINVGQLLNNQKALILHFWSPMSQETQINLSDFILTSQACDKHNIGVASILIGKYPEIIKDAENIRKTDASKAACSWLVDTNRNTLSNQLRVTSIPTMVIVSIEGKILFNGQPSNNEFWNTIKQLAPNFKRPSSPQHMHAENNTHE